MDKIFIRALKTETIIGIFDWERQVKQTVLIDIELSADIRRAALSDSVEDTLNYKRVAKRVLAFVEASRFHLLSKPGAVRSSRDVGVALERDRSRLDEWRKQRAAS
jgi:dihydroneopterin aldolase